MRMRMCMCMSIRMYVCMYVCMYRWMDACVRVDACNRVKQGVAGTQSTQLIACLKV